jgi:4-hydroxy-tetrahydrodipicolinate synthase
MRGTIPALVTPFRDGGRRVDLPLINQHLEWLREAGIESVLVAGTTGEGQSLSLLERLLVVAWVRERHPDLALMAATGFNALPSTIDVSQRALDLGADSLLIAPPCYFPSSDAEVIAFFAAVADELPPEARIVIYHIPRFTGAPISVGAVRELRDRFGPRIAGLKDSGGDRAYHEQVLRELPDIDVYGSDGLAALSYASGAAGVVSALANVLPRDFLAMEQAAAAGVEIPAEIEPRLAELRSLTHSVPQRSGLKHLVHLVAGLPVSPSRAPELPLTADQTASLETSTLVASLTNPTGA